MSLKVHDARLEVQTFSDPFMAWVYGSTTGDQPEVRADTLGQGYSDVFDCWHDRSFITTSENTLRRFLSDLLANVPQIGRVAISEREKYGETVVEVWIALTESTRDIRYRVYELEEQILERFQGWLFDFHVFLDRDELPSGDVDVYGKQGR